MKQGSSQKVQEWRAQVEMLTTRWCHAQRTADETLVPEQDKVAWGRVMDRVFQDHTKRIFSDGLRAEFAIALTLPTLDERHALAVDIEERLLRAFGPCIFGVFDPPSSGYLGVAISYGSLFNC